MEALIEKCTSDKNTQDNWDLILQVCEEYGTREPKACVKCICKRILNKNANVSMRAITLLDACSKNCGKVFNRELASKDFSQAIKKGFSSLQRIPSLKLIELFEKWSEEFKNDSELSLAASLYTWVKNEHPDLIHIVQEDKKMTKPERSRQHVTQIQSKEEEELAMAIALSLKETEAMKFDGSTKSRTSTTDKQKSTSQPTLGSAITTTARSSAAPPTFQTTSKTYLYQPKGQVRALYDFEAVEDNELTFKTGELIVLLDDSDENWWFGSNQRGEGLFPAQFVKRESDHSEPTKIQTTNIKDSKVESIITPQLDERKLDQCLTMINNIDPTRTDNFDADPKELKQLERECLAMNSLIDSELELIDKNHLNITQLNQYLLDAFQLYQDLMSQQEQLYFQQRPQFGNFSTPSYAIPNQYISNPAMGYGHPQSVMTINSVPAISESAFMSPRSIDPSTTIPVQYSNYGASFPNQISDYRHNDSIVTNIPSTTTMSNYPTMQHSLNPVSQSNAQIYQPTDTYTGPIPYEVGQLSQPVSSLYANQNPTVYYYGTTDSGPATGHTHPQMYSNPT